VDVVEAGDVGEEEEGEAEEADARIYVYIGVLSPSGSRITITHAWYLAPFSRDDFEKQFSIAYFFHSLLFIILSVSYLLCTMLFCLRQF